jgi:hypothetical protein
MTLSTEDAAQFFRLMWGLQFFVNQQLRLLPRVRSFEDGVTAGQCESGAIGGSAAQ